MYDAIIQRHRPAGFELIFSMLHTRRTEAARERYEHKRPNRKLQTMALCYWDEKIIRLPFCKSRFGLGICLHEFAHVHLKHWTRGKSTTHREEWEAEMWAVHVLHAEGIPVPKSLRRSIKCYMRACIKRDRKAGISIEKHIERYANRPL